MIENSWIENFEKERKMQNDVTWVLFAISLSCLNDISKLPSNE